MVQQVYRLKPQWSVPQWSEQHQWCYMGVFQCHCRKLAQSSLFRHEAETQWLKTYHTVTMATNVTFTLRHPYLMHSTIYYICGLKQMHKRKYLTSSSIFLFTQIGLLQSTAILTIDISFNSILHFAFIVLFEYIIQCIQCNSSARMYLYSTYIRYVTINVIVPLLRKGQIVLRTIRSILSLSGRTDKNNGIDTK